MSYDWDRLREKQSDTAEVIQGDVPDPRRNDEPSAITTEEGRKHGASSDCPKCGALGLYGVTEFGDEEHWQDASCQNGHAWREFSRFVAIVALDDEGEEIGYPVPSGFAAYREQ